MFRELLNKMGIGKLAPKPVKLISYGRHKVSDIAFNLRMPGGSAGDITRHTPPGTVEQCLMDPSTPPTAFGQAVVADQSSTNGVRLVQAGDSSLTSIYGITVRPYPYQQVTTGNSYGAVGIGGGAPAPAQPVDVLRSGYVLAPCQGTPTKGAPVYVWVAASSGPHVQGGFETSNTGGSTIQLDSKTTFQGGLDSNGNAEIAFNI